MALFLHEGKLLINEGKLATADACCCGVGCIAELTEAAPGGLGINPNVLAVPYGGTYVTVGFDTGAIFNVTLSASHAGAPCGNAFWGEITNPRSILYGANLVGGESWIEVNDGTYGFYYEHYGLFYDCDVVPHEWVLRGHFGHYITYTSELGSIYGRSITIREHAAGIALLGGTSGNPDYGNIPGDLTILSYNPFHAIATFTTPQDDPDFIGYPMPDFEPLFCGEATIEFTE